MAKSELASALDKIQARVAPELRSRGFRSRGRTFNRTSPDGLTQVLSIQMGSSDPPGTTYLPGLRENLYGRFTVNLGVYVPEVAEKHGGGAAKQWIREYDCCIRCRLGELGTERQDVWWSINHEEAVVQDLLPRICHDAMFFFCRYESRAAILDELDGKNEYVGSPTRIISAIIRWHRGEVQRARDLLNQQVKETHNPGHPAYVRALADRLGVGPLE